MLRGPHTLPPTPPPDRSPRIKRNGCISIPSGSKPSPSKDFQSLSFLQSPTHARSNSGSLLLSTTSVSSNTLPGKPMPIDAASFKDAFANIWDPVASGSGSGAPVSSASAVYPPEPPRKRFSHSAASYATYSSALASSFHHQHHHRESKRSSSNNSHDLRNTTNYTLICPSHIDTHNNTNNSLSSPSHDRCSCRTPSPSSSWTSAQSKRKGNSPTAKQEQSVNTPSTSPSPSLSSSSVSLSSSLSTSPVILGTTNMARCSPDLPPSLRLLPEDVHFDACPSSSSSNASSLMSSPTRATATDKPTYPTSTQRRTTRRRPVSMDSALKSFGCDCCSGGCNDLVEDYFDNHTNIANRRRRTVKGLSGGYFSCGGDTTTTGVVHAKDTTHVDTINKNASLQLDRNVPLLLSTSLVDMPGDRPHHPLHHPHKNPCLSTSCTLNDNSLAHSHFARRPSSPVNQHHQHHHNRHHRHISPSVQVDTTESPAQISSRYIRLLLLPLLPLLILAVFGHTSSKFESPMKYNV